jgi:hypothetical protein
VACVVQQEGAAAHACPPAALRSPGQACGVGWSPSHQQTAPSAACHPACTPPYLVTGVQQPKAGAGTVSGHSVRATSVDISLCSACVPPCNPPVPRTMQATAADNRPRAVSSQRATTKHRVSGDNTTMHRLFPHPSTPHSLRLTVQCWQGKLLDQTVPLWECSEPQAAPAKKLQLHCCEPHLVVLLLLAPCLQR